ncbi:PknH-like protein [Streptomyces sp. TLI_235]|nr:PknH-like protein [Streptomyces sp. TLI_235]
MERGDRVLTGGNTSDCTRFEHIMQAIRVPRVGSGRPRTRPDHVIASECAVAAGPTTQSVYGEAWTAFLSATYQDTGGGGAYTVNQVIGVFPDTGKAAVAFRTLTDGLTKCAFSTVTDQACRTAKLAYTAHPPYEVVVAWKAAQAGAANWACYHQARVRSTSLVQVAVCQAGDDAPTTSKITDELAGKVAG